MSFFDKIFSQVQGSSNDTVQFGFIGICISAAGADGNIDDDEWGAIVGYISRLKMFSEVKDSEINKMFNKAIGILRSKGSSALMTEASQNIPNELKNTAFACICDILLSDGTLEQEERSVLEQAYRCLNIDESQAATIMEVMLIKNKM